MNPGVDSSAVAFDGRRLFGLLALISLAYVNSLPGAFHYDDSHSIVENRSIRTLSRIPAFFADSGTFSAEPTMAMYRPLVQTTYAANYAVGGLRPWGYHLTNLAIHLLVVALVSLTAARLAANVNLGWWVALLWGVHPVHTQIVNYVSSRSESLAAAAVMGALYLGTVVRPPKRWAAAAYAAGLLAKSSAVVLLPLAALLRLSRATSPRRIPAELWPYGAVTAVYLAVIWSDGFLPRSLAQDVRPWGQHLMTQTKALVYYLQLVVTPIGLSVEPAFRVSRSWMEPAVVCSGLLILSLAWLSRQGLRRGFSSGVGVFWFLAGLAVPFVIPLNVLVNEHRLYLPSVGLALTGAWLLRHRVAPSETGGSPAGTGHGAALGPWAAVFAVLLAALTVQRNEVWASELSLWEDAAARAPAAFRVHSNLGLARYEAGDLAGARQALDRALDLNPGYAKTWNNLGLVLEAEGADARALSAYAKSLEVRPDLTGARMNLARLHLARGELPLAAVQLDTALALSPEAAGVYVHLGRLRQREGNVEAAALAYQRAIELDPESAAAWNNLGLLREELGDRAGGRAALRRATQVDPSFAEAQVNLRLLETRLAGRDPRLTYEDLLADFPEEGGLWKAHGRELLRRGETATARDALEEAARLKPRDPETLSMLATARRLDGDLDGAIEAYRAAIALGPSAALYTNLASAHAAGGRADSARIALEAALKLDPGSERARAGLERLDSGGRP